MYTGCTNITWPFIKTSENDASYLCGTETLCFHLHGTNVILQLHFIHMCTVHVYIPCVVIKGYQSKHSLLKSFMIPLNGS